MKNTSRVTLEILRKGTEHNQLLSPYTEYFGLCGNYGATPIHLPWEHRQFTTKVRALFYPELSDNIDNPEYMQRRQDAIEELARNLADILETIKGLLKGINDRTSCEAAKLTHLRLVISAAELSMLPFELSKNLAGMSGGENWLSLHTTSPVCITRQVRSVTHRSIKWPVKPKILFIAASPTGKIPLKEHLHALVESVMPWIEDFDPKEKKLMMKNTAEMLTVLPEANIAMIEKACRKENYTHIHILAHGTEDEKTPGNPYGLALHDIDDPTKADVVTGTRLATAICPLKDEYCGPAVVTVASCNSGSTNSVVYNTGASLVHDLHNESIPLIIGSQYPLTFAGSVMLVEEVYGNLLWGADPLRVLHNLRTRLYSTKSNDNHDWASLIVYECFEDTLQESLDFTAYKQTRSAIDNVMRKVDTYIKKKHSNDTASPNQKTNDTDKESKKIIDGMIEPLYIIYKKFPVDESYQPEISGLKGSAEKRRSECYYKIGVVDDSYEALMLARKQYDSAIRKVLITRTGNIKLQSSVHWLITQYLALSLVTEHPFEEGLWYSAKLSAENDLALSKDQEIWANGSLAELHLILVALPVNQKNLPFSKSEAREKARQHIANLKKLAVNDDFPIMSTARQLKRYLDWWCQDDFMKYLRVKKSLNENAVVFDKEGLLSCVRELLGILGADVI